MIHPKLRQVIKEEAKEAGVALQYLTVSESLYITDSPMIAKGYKGIPTATIAIPRRYSHSPVEMLNLNDAVDTLKLLRAIVAHNGQYDLNFL